MQMLSINAVHLVAHFHSNEALGADIASEGVCVLPSKEHERRVENKLMIYSEVNWRIVVAPPGNSSPMDVMKEAFLGHM